MQNESLEKIRLELRGPIAQSPFAGRKKKLKLDYCDRQIKLLSSQYYRSGIKIFYSQILKWTETKRFVNEGKL